MRVRGLSSSSGFGSSVITVSMAGLRQPDKGERNVEVDVQWLDT